MKTYTASSFAELLRSSNPHNRGRRFETLVAEALRTAGFDVDLGSPAAKPRQTDLFATYGKEAFLWELKWHSTRADIDHIRGLRDRLRTMAPGAVGVLCSVSGFTKSVLNDVVQNRKEGLVLLVDGFEAYQVIDRRFDVRELLDKKREELVRWADVWFLEEKRRRPVFPGGLYRLPSTSELIGLESDSPYIASRTVGMSNIMFTRQHLFFGEYGPTVPVFRLRLDVVETLKELEQLIGLVHKELHFSESPEFAIHQTNAIWTGIGAKEFLKCAKEKDARYASTKTKLHHSEELCLFGKIRNGLIAISVQQGASNPFRLHSGELTVRLTAHPLDMTPYKSIARAVCERHPGFTAEEPLKCVRCALPKNVSVRPLKRVTISQNGNRDVVGLVVRNPFFKRLDRLEELISESCGSLDRSSPLARFAELETILCLVKDWIPEKDEVTGWHLVALDGVLIDSLWVLHASCTWNDLKHHPRRTSPSVNASLDSLPDFELEWRNEAELEEELKSWRRHPSEKFDRNGRGSRKAGV